MRDGDVITDPEPGLWTVLTCISNNNQFIQEAELGNPVYLEISFPEGCISNFALDGESILCHIEDVTSPYVESEAEEIVQIDPNCGDEGSSRLPIAACLKPQCDYQTLLYLPRNGVGRSNFTAELESDMGNLIGGGYYQDIVCDDDGKKNYNNNTIIRREQKGNLVFSFYCIGFYQLFYFLIFRFLFSLA